jgi:hypothetical protein
MPNESEWSDERIQSAFRVCRDELHSEYNILSGRLNSFITSQSFLVSGYAISMGNMVAKYGAKFSLYFSLLLSVMAIVLSLRAHPGIKGSCEAISRWHNREADLFQLGHGLEDYAVLNRDGLRSIRDKNLLFAQTSAWIFGIAWFLMALLSIYLHLT